MQSMPIICWNPFILPAYLQTDLEQRHLVQMNEPVSLNNSFSPWREFWVGRGAEFSHCFICFQFCELKCKMCNIWWLLVFILARQRQQHNVKMKLEEEEEEKEKRYLALVELSLRLCSCCSGKKQSIKTLHWCEDYAISRDQHSHLQLCHCRAEPCDEIDSLWIRLQKSVDYHSTWLSLAKLSFVFLPPNLWLLSLYALCLFFNLSLEIVVL